MNENEISKVSDIIATSSSFFTDHDLKRGPLLTPLVSRLIRSSAHAGTSYERRSPTRVVIRSRQRVSPETDMFRKERRRKDLRVSTKFEPEGRVPSTPVTDASTPTPRRGSDDLRSPGAKKTPRVASSEEPIPDLITQTDAQGRATTPRSSTAIHQARKIHPSGPKPHLHVDKSGKLSEEDACTETILDSIRMMCCCFLGVSEEEETSPKREEKVLPQKPRLLPSIHPDDNGKKCLVLDLDETLVHSSFRAVANADFVIPVQVSQFVWVFGSPFYVCVTMCSPFPRMTD